MPLEAVVKALRTRDEEALDRFGPVPAFIFELSRDPDPAAWAIAREEPYYEELVNERLSSVDIQGLQYALVEYVRAGPGAYSSSAVWALGKTFEPRLKSFFIEILRREIEATEPEHELLGQCLVALNNLGEKSFSGGSFACNERDKNLADARHYLERIGHDA